ncbi:hypothetical protein FIV06_08955 [Labrenzia sp. THAF191b]|uniref:hypothetical protein n=1 Tax=unclassified Labrenzia TaxID=2648686 RepID=UPI001269405E|nr:MULTISPECIES: hypothetical protein [unclassified Labrenzia]QFS97548.1 hypothetical protein FIV06_08955 [Labrenzia sp. THAF191b]QFT03863.1 hypothetical protein FIV05_08955 [Labrenzia sp. THAF191a]QFT15405.1 hypothetical protein FIV03_08960 [Labrenzia sp. THAF187b]
MSSLVSIGAAQLKVIGLNPQNVSLSSEARVPGRATYTGMDYQLTGIGERSARLEVLTLPFVFGGMDALGWLQAQHLSQLPVLYLRLGANLAADNLGLVVIRELYIDEDRFHPFTGRGRTLNAEIGLLFVV